MRFCQRTGVVLRGGAGEEFKQQGNIQMLGLVTTESRNPGETKMILILQNSLALHSPRIHRGPGKARLRSDFEDSEREWLEILILATSLLCCFPGITCRLFVFNVESNS